MKKLSYLLLVSVFGMTAAQAAKPFNGYYLGVGVGYTQRATTTDLEADGQTIAPHAVPGQALSGKVSHGKRSSGVQYGLYGGHGWVTPANVYMGFEVSLHNDTLNRAKHHHNLVLNNDAVGGKTEHAVTTQHHRGLVFGMAPRIGFMASPNDLIYAKLAVQFSKDRVVHRFEGQPEWKSPTTNQITLVPGIGYERALQNNCLLRIEYSYNTGANLTVNKKAISLADKKLNVGHTEKYTAHEMKLGLAYQF